MIPVPCFAGETVVVMGLARSGLAAAVALHAGGARVVAWDDAPARRDAAIGAGLAVADVGAISWRGVAALVLSPGIPHTHPHPHPVAAAAAAAMVPIIGDIELLARALPHARLVGVTGTNGKSTTTALIGHVLAASGRPAVAAGNIGTPVLALDPLPGDGTYVLELSSYQLELTSTARYRVAVLLNITPDHLDRHGGMAGYIAAKRRIVAGQTPEDWAIIGVDDEPSRALHDTLAAARPGCVMPISGERTVAGGIGVAEGWLVDDLDGDQRAVFRLAEGLALPGRHNAQNAAAAWAAARRLGLAAAEIAPALASFPGLAHRQQRVGEIDEVLFVNDSKATNADAAAKALACYEHIYWIAGGRAKEGGIADLAPYFPRIRHAFLIGEAAEPFARTLAGKVPFTLAGTMEVAVRAAYARAAAERGERPVVLLSPACASFDQFSDFEERGARFAQLVEQLSRDRRVGGGASRHAERRLVS